jgi:hypothetical protein
MVNDPNGPRPLIRTLAPFAIALEIAAVLTTPLSAQSSSSGPSEDQLAKASQNPVANLVSFPLQYNYYTAGGLGPNSQMVLNVQPVLPLPMGKRWLLVSRTIIPFVSIPFSSDTFPVITDFRTGGTADIQEQAYITPAKPGKLTWGAGPIFSFPTATNRFVRTGQWGFGPTAVVLVTTGPWVVGMLANNIWRIGGEAHGHVLNTFTTQPFINFNLPFAWSITTAPIITADWSAADGQKWTVPIGIGVGKITHIGTQAMSFGMQYYHNLNHPSFAGAEQMRFQATLLWPTAAAAAARSGRRADDQ